MKLLLDTSIVLWSVTDESRLNARAREMLASPSSLRYFSAASVWEIAIKYRFGALPLHVEPGVFVAEAMRDLQLNALDIAQGHALEAGRLPAHHRDPFDRMLIAQAREEQLILLTADEVFEKYDVEQVFCGR